MNIEFRASAFTHNIAETDIRHAFMNPRYDGLIENGDKDGNRFIRLGLTPAAGCLKSCIMNTMIMSVSSMP